MRAVAVTILLSLLAIIMALLLSACSEPPRWGVVLLVPIRAEIATEIEPAYQITHVGLDYDTEAACRAVWADRCAQKLERK